MTSITWVIDVVRAIVLDCAAVLDLMWQYTPSIISGESIIPTDVEVGAIFSVLLNGIYDILRLVVAALVLPFVYVGERIVPVIYSALRAKRLTYAGSVLLRLGGVLLSMLSLLLRGITFLGLSLLWKGAVAFFSSPLMTIATGLLVLTGAIRVPFLVFFTFVGLLLFKIIINVPVAYAWILRQNPAQLQGAVWQRFRTLLTGTITITMLALTTLLKAGLAGLRGVFRRRAGEPAVDQPAVEQEQPNNATNQGPGGVPPAAPPPTGPAMQRPHDQQAAAGTSRSSPPGQSSTSPSTSQAATTRRTSSATPRTQPSQAAPGRAQAGRSGLTSSVLSWALAPWSSGEAPSGSPTFTAEKNLFGLTHPTPRQQYEARARARQREAAEQREMAEQRKEEEREARVHARAQMELERLRLEEERKEEAARRAAAATSPSGSFDVLNLG